MLQRDDGEVYSFRIADLEDASSAPPSSVDLYFASNAFQWCDNGRGMEAAATQLRPGGTLALLVFGMRIFQDAEVQELWCELFRMGMMKRKMKGYMSTVVRQTWHMYDWVSVPESLFTPGVERIQFNVPLDWSQTAERITGLARLPDAVGRDDRISVEHDDAWTCSMTLEDIKFAFTSFNFDVDGDADMARLWKDMESTVGKRTVDGLTFGHLILATRR